MTAEWSSSTILYAVVLLSVHVTQCPVSFKGPRSSCQLVFHQWNVSPILCCSSREGMVHLRRGLRQLLDLFVAGMFWGIACGLRCAWSRRRGSG